MSPKRRTTPHNPSLTKLQIDPAYNLIGPTDTALCHAVWNDKYRWGNESYQDTMNRVAAAIMKDELDPVHFERTQAAMQLGLWMPAGRILAGAGTPKRVTLLNCFV